MNTATSDDSISKKLKPIPKKPAAKAKVAKVMGEFKSGDLQSSSGDKVTSKPQALAIAMAEARKAVKK